MKFFIKDAHKHVGDSVTIQGWMYNKRGSGKIYFLQLRDGSGVMQGVVEASIVDEEVMDQAEKLTMESSVKITGKITQHPKKEDVFEMSVREIEIVHIAEEYPIGKKDHGPEFLLDNRHLWLRSPRQLAIQRVRDEIIRATFEYFHQNGFIKIDTPIFSTNACEGSGDLFYTDYFDTEKAYLAQSGQLYLEAAIMSCGRGFDFGPVFRSEKSKTRRHLTEFWMMDAEVAFCDLEGIIKVQEELILHILMRVLQNCQNELNTLERDQEPLKKIKGPFKRMTHAEAVAELQEMGSDITPDKDLGGDDETILTKKYDSPIFVTHYPAPVKAFYMKRDEDGSNCLCVDMLAPEGYGEIIGGSQREEDLDLLKKWMGEHGVSEKGLEWYMDLRRYGSVPHSGFGYGLERIVGWVCGLKHVRETIPFPRLMNRLRP
ncbi:MAG: asparagine--tRNA ligase [Candidatus Gracilibacteria bacterium]|nr:asparagine--tRNA ligase [Candidatus Gracilibacteria bacterium]